MSLETLKTAFDPLKFKTEGYKMIDILSEYLETCQNERISVTEYVEPKEELDFWRQYKTESLDSFVTDLLNRCIRIHHPRYIGHQVSIPLPDQALIGLVSNFANNGMGIYEMGQAPTAIEKLVTDQVSQIIGFDERSGGFLTSGGTLANLTALLAARSKMQDHSIHNSYILVSDQAHYCIDRAARTMGMAPSQVVKVNTDMDYRISIPALDDAHKSILRNGGQVMAVVGCACSTSTGSYDDLQALASFCRRHGYWMHVDGAHGGAALFSDEYNYLLDGLEKADSVVIDAHKMMMVPALATMVLFRDQMDGYHSFNQEAAYLYEKSEPEWFQLTKRTYETTKYMMSANLFWMLRPEGRELLKTFIDRQYGLAREFAEMIRETKDFELAHDPMSNIVCFRFIRPGTSDEKLSFLNKKIREKLLSDGAYYIVQTNLNERLFLRTTLMNPATMPSHLRGLLDECRKIGEAL